MFYKNMSCCIIAQKEKCHISLYCGVHAFTYFCTFQRTVVLSVAHYVFVVWMSYTRRLMNIEATSGCSRKSPQMLFGRCLSFLNCQFSFSQQLGAQVGFVQSTQASSIRLCLPLVHGGKTAALK